MDFPEVMFPWYCMHIVTWSRYKYSITQFNAARREKVNEFKKIITKYGFFVQNESKWKRIDTYS